MTHTYVVLKSNRPERKAWGKNPGATREAIYLSRLATEELRQHMLTWRSNPNPAQCSACRNGVGEHLDAKTNPHRNCDFANDAPVWWDFIKQQRLHPNDYTHVYFATAASLAGLTPETIGFTPTPKLLRATGATLLLDAGVPIAQVAKMGRWQNEDVLRKHYHRMRDKERAHAALMLDNAARGELGLEGVSGASIEERVRFQQRRIEVLEEQVAQRDQLLAGLGIDAENDGVQKGPDLADLWPSRVHRLSDIDRIRELAATAPSQTEMLRELGLQRGNLKRLQAVAAKHEIILPPLHVSHPDDPPPFAIIEQLTAHQLREACTAATSLTHLMIRLGLPTVPKYRLKLEQRATELGVVVPPLRQRERNDYSVLEDADLLRSLAASQPSLAAILNALNLPRTTDVHRRLQNAAEHHGVILPRYGRPQVA